MPILGIIASSRLAPLPPGSYESIATTTVGGGGSASVTLSSIPATYSHLQIRIMGRTDRATNNDSCKLTFNSDTGANYTEHGLYGDGSTAAAYGVTGSTGALTYRLAGANAASNIQGTIIVDILDYANTNKYKTMRSLGGIDINGSGGEIYLNSSVWMNTAAISNIVLTPIGSFQQYSSIALYGIKS